MGYSKHLIDHVAGAIYDNMFPERKGTIYEDERLYLCYYECAKEAIAAVDTGRAIEDDIKCIQCEGQGWVCIEHPNVYWDTCPDCPIKEGIPCPLCNPCDEHNPPRMSPEFETIIDVDGNRFKPKLVNTTRDKE